MKWATPDRELLQQLADIPEVTLSGFSVREGLAGTGVTVLKGRDYFGSWRTVDTQLVWVPANLTEPGHIVETVDEALRQTLLMILKSLQVSPKKPPRALAG
ncbi:MULTISPECIES: hypothetical protein [unclassified Hyphomicrobium]|uniref:hypothetical protein n=1 Tax=unclassified Hyphomicrobium TaxID=2619925 RepID=UPI000213F190|nr:MULTISPECIES: hypothetical protein [unclassified Hyphomicrobium]CCB64196.1 conserved protein of unknown function [Hyphomicrobium sp. MC1]